MAVNDYLNRVEVLLAPDPGGPPTGYISAQDLQGAFGIVFVAIDETYVERFTEAVQAAIDSLNLTSGVRILEGDNAKQGVATLVDGTVTVSNTSVTDTSRILLTAQSLGTVTAAQALAITDRTASTSFTISSADVTDTSVVAWEIFEPA